MTSTEMSGVISRPAPPIPYTDTYHHVEGLTPLLKDALDELSAMVQLGYGEMGLNTTTVFFHVDLPDWFSVSYPCFAGVEEIWLGVDLEAFLTGGEE